MEDKKKKLAEALAAQKQQQQPKEESLYYKLAKGGYMGTSAKYQAEKEGDEGLMGRIRKFLTNKESYEK